VKCGHHCHTTRLKMLDSFATQERDVHHVEQLIAPLE
jgi:hypothetical protein